MAAADGFITLIAPPGAETGAISHGDREFRPYRADHRDAASPWLVDVPAEAAQHLCRKGGFRIFDPAAPP
jgi:hypothetical protein